MILDEVHHAGDARSWGEGVREAFEPATRRLTLTGTPFRSDDNPIPFVDYVPDGEGLLRSRADHAYGYSEALADGVVRPVVFLAYSGTSSWRTSAGEEITARLGEPLTAEQTARAWRTALDPGGEWIPAVLAAADRRLTGAPQRRHGRRRRPGHRHRPDHGAGLRGDPAPTSPAPRPSSCSPTSRARRTRIARVQQVRRPVDGRRPDGVARASTCRGSPSGVYATSASTPLFFAQAVGRFVRSRRPGETASVFLPSVPVLLGLASELEAQRDHVLGKPHRAAEQWDDEELAAANRQQDEPGEDEKSFTALHADAELDQLIYDGTSFSADEEDFIGLPGPAGARPGAHAAQLAAEGVAGPAEAPRPGAAAAPPPPAERPQLTVREQLNGLRKELNTLVALHNHRTKKPHGMIHNELRARLRRPADGDGEHRAARGAHRHAPLLALTPSPQPRVCAESVQIRPANVTERVARSAAPNVTFAGHFVPTRATRGRRRRRRGGNRIGSRPVGVRCEVRRGRAGLESARLHLDVQLAHLVAVGACVVPAEEEFSTGGQDSTDLGGRAATVTAVGGGQLGPGKGSRLHSGLPPSRHRVCPVSLDATNRLRGTSTLADAQHPGCCSRRASRHPSRRDRLEVRPPCGDRPGRSGLRIQLTTGK